MGFWDVVSDVVKGVSDFAEKENKKLEAKKQRYMRDIEREQRKNSGLSNEEVLAKGRSKEASAVQKYAAAKTLQDRGVIKSKKASTTSSDRASIQKTSTQKPTTPAYRAGDNPEVKTTIVLSAPGRHEERAGRPAAAETGKTLQTAIEQLHAKRPDRFPSAKLDDYTIINAAENPEYMAKTGRTEATDEEIREKANVSRLKKALKGADTVVALGDKAQVAIDAAGYSGSVLSSGHPSKQSLNKKYKSDAKTPEDRNVDRIKQWADDISDKGDE